jgi:hypothetical protein
MPSLNQVKRKKEMNKISSENQTFLRRLQDQAPTYSVQRWEEDFKKNLYLRHNLMQVAAYDDQVRVNQFGSVEHTDQF